MDYLRFRTDYTPKITGKRNGGYAVEQNKKSFKDKNIEKDFNDFFRENLKYRERVEWETFALCNIPKDFECTYFPTSKSVKELDIMSYGVNLLGISFMINKRTYDILQKYKIPIHNKIPVKIDTFFNQYFLVGFPYLMEEMFDFKKSQFYNYDLGQAVKFEDADDFKNASYERIMATPIELYLKDSVAEYDILMTAFGLYISPAILKDFQENNIIGYEIREGILKS